MKENDPCYGFPPLLDVFWCAGDVHAVAVGKWNQQRRGPRPFQFQPNVLAVSDMHK